MPPTPPTAKDGLDRGRIRTILLEAARRAGLPQTVSPHWLRHALASPALDTARPFICSKATLGHRSVATPSAYLHARLAGANAFIACFELSSSTVSAARTRTEGQSPSAV